VNCKNEYLNETELIAQLFIMIDKLDLNKIVIKEKIHEEVKRFKNFQSRLLKTKVPIVIKEVVVKDEFGRIQLSKNIKYDEDGIPKWKVHCLDLPVFTENATRYGVWSEELVEFKNAVNTK
jgi:hypothetical protein